MTIKRFSDRTEAGQALAGVLAERGYDAPVVLALPRGGVPVAVPIARALGAPLDLVMVKKIGFPGNPEFAAAAIVDGDEPHLVINDGVLGAGRLSRADIDTLAEAKLAEIARRKADYGAGPPVSVAGRTAIIVDDGIATGASVRAAVQAVRARGAARIVVAVPVAPPSAIRDLSETVDEVVCLSQPEAFFSVGAHFVDFRQVPDAEVKAMMAEFRTPPQRDDPD